MSLDDRSRREGLQRRASSPGRASIGPVRRIVTGFDAMGRATIESDGVPTQVYTIARNGPTIYEICHPSPLRGASSNRIRVLDFLPEGPDRTSSEQVSVRTQLAWMGLAEYCIVLVGEMTLILDEMQTVVRAGDIVVQRDTPHAWVNRSGRLARVICVLADAGLDPQCGGQPG